MCSEVRKERLGVSRRSLAQKQEQKKKKNRKTESNKDDIAFQSQKR